MAYGYRFQMPINSLTTYDVIEMFYQLFYHVLDSSSG